MFSFVKIRAPKPKRHRVKHAGTYVSGDVCVVNEAEIVSFADKFVPAEHSFAATQDAMALMHKFRIKAQSVTGSGKEGRILKPDVIEVLDKDQLAQLMREEEAEKAEA